jgi:hypothetical protein
MPIPAVDNGQSVYNMRVGNRVIQISAAQAAKGSPVLLDHVRMGTQVLIEYDACPVIVLRPAVPAPFLDNAFPAIAQEARDEGWECVPPDLANNLDHCLYVCEALPKTFTR